MESPFGFIEGFQMADSARREAEQRNADLAERAEKNDWVSGIPPGLMARVEALDPFEI